RRLAHFERLGMFSAVVAWFGASALLLVMAGNSLRHAAAPESSAIALTIPTGVLVLGLWWIIRRFGERSFRRALRKKLARYGRPGEVMNRIDVELLDSVHSRQWCKFPADFILGQPDLITLTQNWLVWVRPGNAVVFNLSDLVWVHKRIVPRSTLVRDEFVYELGCLLADGNDPRIEPSSED